MLGLISPGLIILSVRAQFITGRRPPYSEALLYYFVVSVIYYAVTVPFIDLTRGGGDASRTIGWIAIVAIFPAIVGVILGANIQKEWLWRFMRWSGLNTVHAVPTAWDWKLGNSGEAWVLVTFKDESKCAGFWGEQSFASSDPAERDIYLQWLYDIDESNQWRSRGDTGVWIASNEVKTIEFWPYQSEENAHD